MQKNKKLNLKYIAKQLIWELTQFIGIRFLYYKIFPHKEEKNPDFKKPSAFIFWLVSIYVAIFGLASQRYEIQFSD